MRLDDLKIRRNGAVLAAAAAAIWALDSANGALSLALPTRSFWLRGAAGAPAGALASAIAVAAFARLDAGPVRFFARLGYALASSLVFAGVQLGVYGLELALHRHIPSVFVLLLLPFFYAAPVAAAALTGPVNACASSVRFFFTRVGLGLALGLGAVCLIQTDVLYLLWDKAGLTFLGTPRGDLLLGFDSAVMTLAAGLVVWNRFGQPASLPAPSSQAAPEAPAPAASARGIARLSGRTRFRLGMVSALIVWAVPHGWVTGSPKLYLYLVVESVLSLLAVALIASGWLRAAAEGRALSRGEKVAGVIGLVVSASIFLGSPMFVKMDMIKRQTAGHVHRQWR